MAFMPRLIPVVLFRYALDSPPHLCMLLSVFFVCFAEADFMSSICSICAVTEGVSTGKWFSGPGCIDRNVDSSVVCDSCMDVGMVADLGTWDAKRSDLFKFREGSGVVSMRFRESVIDVYKSRCDPHSICKDTFVAHLWLVETRCA